MVKTQTGQSIIESIRDLVTKWGTILSVCGCAIGLFYEHKRGIDLLSDSLARLRADCDTRDMHSIAIRGFGPDGFTDPAIHAALDGHVRAFLKSYTSDFERHCRLWERRLCELNPDIKCPGE